MRYLLFFPRTLVGWLLHFLAVMVLAVRVDLLGCGVLWLVALVLRRRLRQTLGYLLGCGVLWLVVVVLRRCLRQSLESPMLIALGWWFFGSVFCCLCTIWFVSLSSLFSGGFQCVLPLEVLLH